MTAGTSTAPPEEEDPFAEPVEPIRLPKTDTAFDEFLPIYVALAMHTKMHGSFAPDQVDAMDLSLVAALLGITGEPSLTEMHAEWRREYEAEYGPVDAEPVLT